MDKLKKIIGDEAYNNLLGILGQENLEKLASKFDDDKILLNHDEEYVKKADIPEPPTPTPSILQDGWLVDGVVNYDNITNDDLKGYIKKINEDLTNSTTALDANNTEYKSKLINLALSNGAKQFNMHDVNDIFKNTDVSKVEFGDDGLPKGIDDIFADLKANKGYLFKDNTLNAGSAGLNPPSNPVSSVNELSSWSDILSSNE